jgi:hypothetical protein
MIGTICWQQLSKVIVPYSFSQNIPGLLPAASEKQPQNIHPGPRGGASITCVVELLARPASYVHAMMTSSVNPCFITPKYLSPLPFCPMPCYFNKSLSGVPYFFRIGRFSASKATAKPSFLKSMANGIFITIQSDGRGQRVPWHLTFLLRAAYKCYQLFNFRFRQKKRPAGTMAWCKAL